jgi:hypothetical protein
VHFAEPQFNQRIPRIPRFSPKKPFFQVQFNFPDKTKDDYFYIRQNVGLTDFHQDLLVKIGNHAIPKYFVNIGDYRYITKPEGRLTLNPEYKGEAFFLDGESQAWIAYFSPNKIHIKVTVKKPGTLVINQNYHKSWRASLGRVGSYQGLLAAELQKTGEYEVILTYVPVDFYAGLVISVIAIACLFALFKFKKPHQSY